MTEELPPCGHPECARNRNEMFGLAKSLGFKEIHPGVYEFSSTDPERAMFAIRAMVGDVDGLAQDLVAQAEEIARRAAQKDPLAVELIIHNGGRVRARKVIPRAFWSGVRAWWNRHTRKK